VVTGPGHDVGRKDIEGHRRRRHAGIVGYAKRDCEGGRGARCES
jgi:hypothetical protein